MNINIFLPKNPNILIRFLLTRLVTGTYFLSFIWILYVLEKRGVALKT